MMGIDFGSQLAGTTVVCWLEGKVVHARQSEKGRSADAFVAEWLRLLQPEWVALDAPLSLPGVYRGLTHCRDYHYRLADREAKAMSPLFLGGLTARAMQLVAEHPHIRWLEAYPARRAELLGLPPTGLRKKDPEALNLLGPMLVTKGWQLHSAMPTHNHALDALLALCIGFDAVRNEATMLGDANEGLLYC
jgi:predicted nuclease with RNAse H fold